MPSALAALTWAGLALACSGPGASPADDAAAAGARVAAQDHLPGHPRAPLENADDGARAAHANGARMATHAPHVAVDGDGAFAVSLAERIRAEVPEGWRGVFRVPEGCADESCLHWWMASDDGMQRVERWPEVEIQVVVPEAGERHVDPRIVRRQADAAQARLFPGSRVTSVDYGRYEDLVFNNELMLGVAYVRDGLPMRAEIHAWLRVANPRSPTAEPGVRERAGLVRIAVVSAPAAGFDGLRLREQVESVVRLEREGWDAQLDACVARASMIAHMAYLGAQEDSLAARMACEREWDARRRARAGAARQVVGKATPPEDLFRQ